MPYGPHTADDREQCSRRSASTSVDELFDDIPAELRASALDLPPPEPELELAARLRGLAGRNRTDLVSFLGAGVYRHWSPPAVDQLLLRGEWYTAYTPYQPEISQGTLQSIYEYESLLGRARRPRRRLGVALRRRGGHRRSGAHDLPRDAPRPGARLARRPSALSRRRSQTYFSGGLESRRDPARRPRATPPARRTSRRSRRCSPTPTGRSPA